MYLVRCTATCAAARRYVLMNKKPPVYLNTQSSKYRLEIDLSQYPGHRTRGTTTSTCCLRVRDTGTRYLVYEYVVCLRIPMLYPLRPSYLARLSTRLEHLPSTILSVYYSLYKSFARGRKNEHSVERRNRGTNGATGDLKMPRGPYTVQR